MHRMLVLSSPSVLTRTSENVSTFHLSLLNVSTLSTDYPFLARVFRASKSQTDLLVRSQRELCNLPRELGLMPGHRSFSCLSSGSVPVLDQIVLSGGSYPSLFSVR